MFFLAAQFDETKLFFFRVIGKEHAGDIRKQTTEKAFQCRGVNGKRKIGFPVDRIGPGFRSDFRGVPERSVDIKNNTVHMKNLLYLYKIIVYKVNNNVYCREKEEKKQEKLPVD